TISDAAASLICRLTAPGGWSNAGLVSDGEQTLLVDTLFDRPQMLKTMISSTARQRVKGESRDHLDQWAQAAAPKDRGQKKRNVIIAEKDMLDTGARVLAALRRLPDEDRARDPGGRGIPSANTTLCKEKLPCRSTKKVTFASATRKQAPASHCWSPPGAA